MTNLLIQIKKSRIKQKLLELQELGTQNDSSSPYKAVLDNRPQGKFSVKDTSFNQPADTSLILKDTEHQELKRGVQSNGKPYSVRTHRKRFFYPQEWQEFYKNLNTKQQVKAFDILVNTGARINEARNIRKEDINFERGTLTLKVNIAMKKALKKANIRDWYLFSLHNVRKTHGNWLNAHKFTITSICKRLGHDHNTFLSSYASADIFNEEDREGIKSILGDLINGNN